MKLFPGACKEGTSSDFTDNCSTTAQSSQGHSVGKVAVIFL